MLGPGRNSQHFADISFWANVWCEVNTMNDTDLNLNNIQVTAKRPLILPDFYVMSPPTLHAVHTNNNLALGLIIKAGLLIV